MLHILYIGCGGFLGSIGRYLVTAGVRRIVGDSHLPYGTLAANLIGCLLIGWLVGVIDSMTAEEKIVCKTPSKECSMRILRVESWISIILALKRQRHF